MFGGSGQVITTSRSLTFEESDANRTMLPLVNNPKKGDLQKFPKASVFHPEFLAVFTITWRNQLAGTRLQTEDVHCCGWASEILHQLIGGKHPIIYGWLVVFLHPF